LPEETLAQDHYAVLGVPRNASDAEIRAVYIKHAKLYHPDRLGPPLTRRRGRQQTTGLPNSHGRMGVHHKALLNDHVITSYHSYITHCIGSKERAP